MRWMRGKCFLYASGGLFLFIAKRKRKEKATKEGAFYKAAPSLETPLRNRKDTPFNQRLTSDVAREVFGLDSSITFRALRAGAIIVETSSVFTATARNARIQRQWSNASFGHRCAEEKQSRVPTSALFCSITRKASFPFTPCEALFLFRKRKRKRGSQNKK